MLAVLLRFLDFLRHGKMHAILWEQLRHSNYIAPSGSHIVQIRIMCPDLYMKYSKLHAQRSHMACAAQPLCDLEMTVVQGMICLLGS